MALTQGINTNLTKEEYDAFIREQQRALAASKSATGTSPSGVPSSNPQTPSPTQSSAYSAADLAKQLNQYFTSADKVQSAYNRQLQQQQAEFQKKLTSLGSELGNLSSSFKGISGQWGQLSTSLPQMFQGILTALDVQGQVPGVPSYLPGAYRHDAYSWDELFG